jgi:phage gpG-like protein
VDRTLLRFGERAMDATLLWEAVGEDLLNMEFDLFQSEGASGASGKWADLAPSTIARKGHDTILQDTGELMASLTQRDAQGERGGNIFEVTPEHLRFGTSDPVAGYHQSGTSRMPQRKVIDLKEEQKAGLVSVVQRFIIHGDRGYKTPLTEFLTF